MELVVRVKPLSGLRLHGAGDRSARTPGPGAIPGEEPLLPRVETLLGLLAGTRWRLEGRGWSCTDWWSCVMNKAEEMLCRGELEYVTGPFLVTRTETGTRVYVNAATALLELSGLSDYLYAAMLLAKEARAYTPGERMRLRRQAAEVLRKLREEEKLVPSDAVAQRLTGIALDPSTRTTRHGLIYSQARVDYAALGKDPEVILVARCASEPVVLDRVPAALRPRSAPVMIRAEPVTLPCLGSDAPALVLSPSPLDPGEAGSLVAVHPWPPRPPLEQLAKAYQPEPWRHEKTGPAPALWPGTIILEGEVPRTSKIMHMVNIDQLQRLYNELRILYSSAHVPR